MLKQNVTYVNYNDEECTEEIYFNLTKAELIELEMSRGGGLGEALKRVVAANDGRAIIKEFKNIIMLAYGEKSEDGRRFLKNQAVLDAFMSSEVYSEFFMNLITTDGAAAEFITKVIPQALVDEVTEAIKNGDTGDTDTPVKDEPIKDVTVINRSELNTMSPADKARVMASIEAGDARINEDL